MPPAARHARGLVVLLTRPVDIDAVPWLLTVMAAEVAATSPAALARDAVDVVVMDLRVKRVDGVEATRWCSR